MAIVSSDVTERIIDEHEGPSGGRASSWIPRWLRRRREAEDLARWLSRVERQWTDTMDAAQLAEHSMSACRLPVVVVPQVQSVDPGPPVTLLVRMLPGQGIDDFQDKADRIATGMEASSVHITPFDDGLINVVLLEQ